MKNKKYSETDFGENWSFTGNENEAGYLQQGRDMVVGIANAEGKSISKSIFSKILILTGLFLKKSLLQQKQQK